jgi:hypothetical protein
VCGLYFPDSGEGLWLNRPELEAELVFFVAISIHINFNELTSHCKVHPKKEGSGGL